MFVKCKKRLIFVFYRLRKDKKVDKCFSSEKKFENTKTKSVKIEKEV